VVTRFQTYMRHIVYFSKRRVAWFIFLNKRGDPFKY
jgi:hypothetical protein